MVTIVLMSSTEFNFDEDYLMRGDDRQQNHIFSYLSPEARVRKDHPLRAIRVTVDEVLSRLSPRFDQMYARVGRPSVDGREGDRPVVPTGVGALGRRMWWARSVDAVSAGRGRLALRCRVDAGSRSGSAGWTASAPAARGRVRRVRGPGARWRGTDRPAT